MLLRNHGLAAMLLASTATASNALAQTLVVPFTGEVEAFRVFAQPGPPFTVTVGTPITGALTIDTDRANAVVTLPTTTVYTHPDDTMSIALRAGSQLWVASESGTSTVRNDEPGQGDLLSASVSSFDGPHFPGSTNGTISVRWEDTSAPFSLLNAPTLPTGGDQFRTGAASDASGVVFGGTWDLQFSITISPLRFVDVDDSDPEQPSITFELYQDATGIDFVLGDVTESLGPLLAGTHQVSVSAPRSLPVGEHALVATIVTANGISRASADLDTGLLADATNVTKWVPILITGLPGVFQVTIRTHCTVRSWDWNIPGGSAWRFVESARVSATSTLPPDATMPGGNPTIRHHLPMTALLEGAPISLRVKPGLGNNVYWSKSFGATLDQFARPGTKIVFTAIGSTSLPHGLSPWNLGLGTNRGSFSVEIQ